MITPRTFAQRCTVLALDIERNALELGPACRALSFLTELEH